MNRIKYQYQILRYMPDLVSGEFVNVGVVIYQREQRFLRAEVIHKYGRITQFFEEVNGPYLMQTLKHIKAMISKQGEQVATEMPFELPESLDVITNRVLPKDDSALFFTEVGHGVDLDLQTSFEKLAKRYIYEPQETEHSFSDKEVWQKIYKPFFEKQGIASKLHQKTITTGSRTITFENAYKNGHWNCLEAANFDMKYKENVDAKIDRVLGKLVSMAEWTEELEYHVLAHTRKGDNKTARYLKANLDGRQIGRAKINLVTEAKVSSFVKRVKTELEEHS